MAQENLDWVNLDAIWISHLHLDHCAGLAPFLFGIKWASGIEKRAKPLRITGCVGIRKLLEAIDETHGYRLFEQPFKIEIDEIEATDKPRGFEFLPGLRTESISTPHRPESLALRQRYLQRDRRLHFRYRLFKHARRIRRRRRLVGTRMFVLSRQAHPETSRTRGRDAHRTHSWASTIVAHSPVSRLGRI